MPGNGAQSLVMKSLSKCWWMARTMLAKSHQSSVEHPTVPWFSLTRVLDVHMRGAITLPGLFTAPSHHWMGRYNSAQQHSRECCRYLGVYKQSRRVLHWGRNRVTLQLDVFREQRWLWHNNKAGLWSWFAYSSVLSLISVYWSCNQRRPLAGRCNWGSCTSK